MKRGMGHGRRDSSQRKQKEAGRQGAGMENRQRKRQGQAERQAGGTGRDRAVYRQEAVKGT